MSAHSPSTGHSIVHLAENWMRQQQQRTLACRSCDSTVRITETICPTCGASDPARVPWSAVTAVFATAATCIVAMMTWF